MAQEPSDKSIKNIIYQLYGDGLLNTAHSDILKQKVVKKIDFFKQHLKNRVLVEIGSGHGFFAFPLSFNASYFRQDMILELSNARNDPKQMEEILGLNDEPFIKTLGVSKFILLDPYSNFKWLLQEISNYLSKYPSLLAKFNKHLEYYNSTCIEVEEDALAFLKKQADESMIVCSAGAFDLYDAHDNTQCGYLIELSEEIFRVTPTRSISFHLDAGPLDEYLGGEGGAFKELLGRYGDFQIYYKRHATYTQDEIFDRKKDLVLKLLTPKGRRYYGLPPKGD